MDPSTVRRLNERVDRLQWATARLLQARALRGAGPLGRAAAALLCRWLLGRRPEETVAAAVARVACSAPAPRARDRAWRALAAWDERDYRFRALVVFGLQQAGVPPGRFDHSPQLGNPVPAAVVGFLVAEVPDCAYRPAVRLTQFLADDELPLPRLLDMRHSWVAEWIVDAALHGPPDPAYRALLDVLAVTDQPDLLAALQSASSPDLLWRDGRAAPLTEALLANPHFPLPVPERAGGSRIEARQVLLAVLQGRISEVLQSVDVVSASTVYVSVVVNALLKGPGPGAPAVALERVHQALCGLAPGPAREKLCEAAVAGHPAAVAAVVEAGHLPADQRDHLGFLVVTGQWERYDAADPDGERLRAYCVEQDVYLHDADEHTRYIRGLRRIRIRQMTAQAGRPDPYPARPEPRPMPGQQPGRRALGSWPTSSGPHI